MNNKERRAIEKYVLEVFHYEHQCSTEILARMMLLCELLIEKGVLTDEEVIDVELVDVYEEDIDAICDDYRLGMYDDMEEDVYDDEETINKYFYGS